ncbi:RNI-like protein [Pisolithus marmoratus]|nr:RNI-like protein [Pisolithus marmoratus]
MDTLALDWELDVGWDPGYLELKHVVNRLPANFKERAMTRGIIIDDPSTGITEHQILNEIYGCRKLQSLVLTGVRDLSDRTIIELARTIDGLRGLQINGCKYVSDVGILELVAKAPPLEYLYVGGGVVLTDPTISAIAKTFPKLQELDLSEGPLITAVSARDVWSFSRRLRCLSFARCPQLTDTAFPCQIKDRGKKPELEDKPLPHRPLTWIEQLEPLMLRHTAVDMRILDLSGLTKITDEAVAGVVVHCPALDKLSLAGCTNLTDHALKSVAKLGVNLSALNLARIPHITDSGVMKLAQECIELRSIDLAFCRQLTDLAVMELAGLQKLNRLVLVRVPKVTDNAIYFLGDHTPTLERLHLSYCDRVSLKSLHHLIRRSRRLEHLTITGVPAARRKGLGRFSDPPPERWPEDQKAVFRVFSGENIGKLCQFLDKEKIRRRQAEAQNIPFVARSDDRTDLY